MAKDAKNSKDVDVAAAASATVAVETSSPAVPAATPAPAPSAPAQNAESVASAAPVAVPALKQIAARDIVHAGKTIRKGQEIPSEFPSDSRELLTRSGDIQYVPA